jgi:hypothetical protein
VRSVAIERDLTGKGGLSTPLLLLLLLLFLLLLLLLLLLLPKHERKPHSNQPNNSYRTN